MSLDPEPGGTGPGPAPEPSTTPVPSPEPSTTPVPAPARVAQIEVLERDGQVRQSFVVRAWPMSLGRALDNDVVLSDPHVAPAHLRINATDRGLLLTVGDTVNGVASGSRRWRSGEQVLLPADGAGLELTLGRTRLRLRLPGQAVAAELPLGAVATHGQRLGTIALAAGVLLAGLLFTTYLDADPDTLVRAMTGMLLASLAGTALWCGLWSLLSKTFTHQTRFGWHLRVFLLASIAWMVVDVVPPLLAFALSWPVLTRYAFVASLGVGAAALYFHLLAVEPARPRLLRRIVVSGWVVGVLVMSWFNLQRTGRLGGELYMSHLFPPALRVAKPVSTERFVGRLQRLQPALDKKAKEAPSGDTQGVKEDE